MQPVPVATNIVSLNPAHDEMYSIQHVIKFVSDLRHCQWFSPGTLVSSTNKTYHHSIFEILFKVALNTIASQQTFLYPPQQSCRGYTGFTMSVRPSVDKSYVVR